MHIVSVDEMRLLETRAAEEYGLTSPILMENAGKSAAEILARYIAEKDSQHRAIDTLEFLVLVGPGNNGGGGIGMGRPPAAKGGHLSSYSWRANQIQNHRQPLAAGDG